MTIWVKSDRKGKRFKDNGLMHFIPNSGKTVYLQETVDRIIQC